MDTKEAGKRGGKARAKKLTPKQRSESASIAAMARWKARASATAHEADLAEQRAAERLAVGLAAHAKRIKR
ncbi:MAG: hypothetical protein ACYDC3_18380 [Candidatus Binataceae bacterium]